MVGAPTNLFFNTKDNVRLFVQYKRQCLSIFPGKKNSVHLFSLSQNSVHSYPRCNVKVSADGAEVLEARWVHPPTCFGKQEDNVHLFYEGQYPSICTSKQDGHRLLYKRKCPSIVLVQTIVYIHLPVAMLKCQRTAQRC